MAEYEDAVKQLDTPDETQMLEAAAQYNRELAEVNQTFILDDAEMKRYERQLCTGEKGIMGILDIPQINIRLPIYHGAAEETLQVGAGHLPGSSLPVGGSSCHAVIVGHRGLRTAKLFTGLDRLREGDRFYIHRLGGEVTYTVHQIETVLPENMQALEIQEGKDLCTLMTCTPYGVNSHRLLVTGIRQHNQEDTEKGKNQVDSSRHNVRSNAWQSGKVVGWILALPFFLFFVLMPYRVMAAEERTLIPEKQQNGKVIFDTGISGAELLLYRAAEQSGEGWHFTDDFSDCTEPEEWKNGEALRAVAETLSGKVFFRKLSPAYTLFTDDRGYAEFDEHEGGMLLVMTKSSDIAVLVNIADLSGSGQEAPGDTANGENRVIHLKKGKDASGKGGKYRSIAAHKLWQKNDGTTMPESDIAHRAVQLILLRNGEYYAEKTVDAARGWNCRWQVERDDSCWAVTEQDIPKDCTLSVSREGDHFTVINRQLAKSALDVAAVSKSGHTPEAQQVTAPGKAPRTGDEPVAALYILGAGVVLTATGIFRQCK